MTIEMTIITAVPMALCLFTLLRLIKIEGTLVELRYLIEMLMERDKK